MDRWHTLDLNARSVPSVSVTLSRQLRATLRRSGTHACTWGDKFLKTSNVTPGARGFNGRKVSLVISLKPSTCWPALANLWTNKIASSCLNTVCCSEISSFSWRLQEGKRSGNPRLNIESIKIKVNTEWHKILRIHNRCLYCWINMDHIKMNILRFCIKYGSYKEEYLKMIMDLIHSLYLTGSNFETLSQPAIQHLHGYLWKWILQKLITKDFSEALKGESYWMSRERDWELSDHQISHLLNARSTNLSPSNLKGEGCCKRKRG